MADEDIKLESKKSPVVLIAIIGVVVFLLIIVTNKYTRVRTHSRIKLCKDTTFF